MSTNWFPEAAVTPPRGAIGPASNPSWTASRATPVVSQARRARGQTSAHADMVAQGMTDSPVHSLEHAISVMRTYDTLRDQLSRSRRQS